jgi:low affinity Fe/Cu permease
LAASARHKQVPPRRPKRRRSVAVRELALPAGIGHQEQRKEKKLELAEHKHWTDGATWTFLHRMQCIVLIVSRARERAVSALRQIGIQTIEAESMMMFNSRGQAASDHFGRFASWCSMWLGSQWAFVLAGLVIVVWALSGSAFHFSDTWQLVINTGTTIVTFLMVFLIQNSQNRDARAINLKLDELIRAIDKARNHMINIESLSDVELDLLQSQYEKLQVARTRKNAEAPPNDHAED